MFSVLRLAYNDKCCRYKPVDADSKLNDLLIEGSYMPWQIQHEGALQQMCIIELHCFHEAGHALARVYEGQEDRLYDMESQLKFLGDFDVPKNGWGKKAGMHEARAHAFSILIQEVIDPEYTVTEDMHQYLPMMAGACSEIAHGSIDLSLKQPFKDEINQILEEITLGKALVMWQELCKRLYTHQQTINMDDMDKNIDVIVADTITKVTI